MAKFKCSHCGNKLDAIASEAWCSCLVRKLDRHKRPRGRAGHPQMVCVDYEELDRSTRSVQSYEVVA